MLYFGPEKNGFYDESIHGARKLLIIDPAFVWPKIEVETQIGVELINDPAVVPPMVEIDNPACMIPADAVEITAEEHAALIAGQSQGKRIVADENGRPILQDPPAPTASEIWDHIKSKRDAIKAGGVKVGTKWYHTDTESRIQHLGLQEKARAARAAGGTDATRLQALGQDIKWKTMDGSFIYLTVKHAEDIFAAVTDLDAAAFAAAETHRVAMEASADPAAYDFSVGWPATFAG